MEKFQQFLAQYIDAVSEGGEWQDDGNFKNAALTKYWEHLLDTRLSNFGFLINVNIAPTLQQNAEHFVNLPNKAATAEYYSDSEHAVTICINKNQIAENIHQGPLPKTFDEVSQFLAKIIHQQALNSKYKTLSETTMKGSKKFRASGRRRSYSGMTLSTS